MLYHILSSVLSYLIKNKLTVFLSLFPVTKVWILNSRVMTHKHHRQVSEGHNHSTLTILNRNSPTVNKEAYLQGKKMLLKRLERYERIQLCFKKLSIFTVSDMSVLETSVFDLKKL